jgi:hypothetical protein
MFPKATVATLWPNTAAPAFSSPAQWAHPGCLQPSAHMAGQQLLNAIRSTSNPGFSLVAMQNEAQEVQSWKTSYHLWKP